MTAQIIRGNALALPLADASVDLVCTSPPYFGLRAYSDNGETYGGQLGSEPTPAEYVDALIGATREMVRVLKPSGSIWVNLGDKYAGSDPGRRDKESMLELDRRMGRSGASALDRAGVNRTDRPTYGTVRSKSLIGIPARYMIRCVDELGLILRAEVIWSKANGLPESVRDRVRRSHEQWFHFTREPRYYSAVDEIREEYDDKTAARYAADYGSKRGAALAASQLNKHTDYYVDGLTPNPLGKLPGSVWAIPTQPLKVPAHLGVDHFAAFPMELPRRIITAWSPRDVCTGCGEGRRPVVASVALDMNRPQARRANELATAAGLTEAHFDALLSEGVSDTGRGKATQSGTGKNTAEVYALAGEARAVPGGYSREYLLRRPTGFTYVCACPDTTAPTTPGIILDPFGGTGTTALVASVLGRHGITVDMSSDYCRLAEWRCNDPGERARAMQVDKPAVQVDGQEALFEVGAT